MVGEKVTTGQLVTAWGPDAVVEVMADNTVWIMRADGTHRTPMREWVENDVRLDRTNERAR